MRVLFEVLEPGQQPRVERFSFDASDPWTIRDVDLVLSKMYDALADDGASLTLEFGRGARLVLKGAERTARSGWLPVTPTLADELALAVTVGFLRQGRVDDAA
jgi:hypothetical protein